MPNASSDPGSCARGVPGAERDRTVLVVSRGGRSAETLRAIAAVLAGRVDHTDSSDEAIRVTRGLWYDVVLVDASLGDEAMAVCEGLRLGSGGPSVVLYTESASIELVTQAMRCGAYDLLQATSSRAEMHERLAAAARESSARREAAEREARLKRLCGKLDRARREVTGQVGELCTDLAGAYKDLSEQIGELALAGELNGLLRQELDIEGLLRVFLEYLLGQVGSTNAGVFLPNSMGDYTLGAYINYDRPKETAEADLDEIAGVVGPAFEGDRRVARLNRPTQLRSKLGEFASCFEGQTVLAVGCADGAAGADAGESECLAVLCLFRDRRTPFNAQAVRSVQIAAELFGRQMGRVIRVHHRVSGDEFWGEGDSFDDDIDLAA